MLASFLDREITHVQAYANLTDTLGLGDQVYTEFLDIPVMETKISYLEKAKVKISFKTRGIAGFVKNLLNRKIKSIEEV